MGQKVHPIAVRISTNRSFNAWWYAEHTYPQILSQDVFLREYVNAFFLSASLNKEKCIPARFYSLYAAFHQEGFFTFFNEGLRASVTAKSGVDNRKMPSIQKTKNAFFAFFLNPFIKNTVEEKNKLSSGEISSFKNTQNHVMLTSFIFHTLLCKKKKLTPETSFWVQNIHTAKNLNEKLSASSLAAHGKSYAPVPMLSLSQNGRKDLHAKYILRQTPQYIENLSFQQTGSSLFFFPVQLDHVFQSASSVARLAASQMEQGKSFRAVWKGLTKELSSQKNIQGLRIVCAGRLGGAEMAKSESRKWGQSSLHVFSQKVDFSRYTASTSFGSIGVKVWICYS